MPFDHPQAERLANSRAHAGRRRLPPRQTRQLLDALADAHLIEPVTQDRYRFHDLLRAYADELARKRDTEEERHHAVDALLTSYDKIAGVRLRHTGRMSSEAVAGLREVYDVLASFDQPSSIHRADELKDAADKVASCAVDLVDVDESHDVQHRLASAVRALKAAGKAARTHRRNVLTRPLSHTRFAWNVGSAHGALYAVLEKLDPTNTPPLPRP